MTRTSLTRPSVARRSVAPIALVVSLVLAGCASPGSGSDSAAPSRAAASAGADASATAELPSPAASEPTESLAPFECTPSVTIPSTTDRAQITDVRVGTHEGYDRIVFEFDSGLPDVTIAGVVPPLYSDPSGQVIEVTGTAFLRVTMQNGTRVTPDGTLTYSGSTNFEPGFDRLLQLVEGGDFEAVSTWYLGLNGGSCIRTLTLESPSRLVIDIEH